MKNCHAQENQTTHRILLIACATALAVAFTVALPQPAHADRATTPPVPANLEVPAGNTAFLEGHAVGTQNSSARGRWCRTRPTTSSTEPRTTATRISAQGL